MDNIFKDSVPDYLHNSTAFYVIATDLAGKYAYTNHLFAKKFAFITDNFIGKDCTTLAIHPEEIQLLHHVVAKCFENSPPISIHLRKPDAKGDYYWTNWEFSVLQDTKATPIGIFCIGYDISESERLRYHVQSLLTQLEEKNETLKRQNEALREIARRESHEMRRPLANILGLVDVINLQEQEKAQYISQLIQVAKELDSVIHKIVHTANENELDEML
jgi:PAS domain S-box-containing protein